MHLGQVAHVVTADPRAIGGTHRGLDLLPGLRSLPLLHFCEEALSVTLWNAFRPHNKELLGGFKDILGYAYG